jgi:hypothetical protein
VANGRQSESFWQEPSARDSVGSANHKAASVKHFIATFDIETTPGEPHERFSEAAHARGWASEIVVSGQCEKLPANTLIGSFPDIDSAQDAFETAVAEANRIMLPAQVVIERRYIVQRVPAGRFTAKREWVKTNIARLNKFIRRKHTA